jgi:hypothetical protein
VNTLKRTEGQSLVEFAVVATLLIVVLFGVFDLARAFNAYIVITNAAREGAYYGSLHAWDSDGIIIRVLAEAENSGITITESDVTITTEGDSGDPITVRVGYDFPLLTSWLLGVDTIHLTGHAEMAVY